METRWQRCCCYRAYAKVHFRSTLCAMAPQMESYFEDQLLFYNLLRSNVKKETLIRLYKGSSENDYGWNTQRYGVIDTRKFYWIMGHKSKKISE